MTSEITCDVIFHFDVFTGLPVTACSPPHTGSKLLKIGPWTSCVTLRRHVTGKRPFGSSRPPPIDLSWRLDVTIILFFSSFFPLLDIIMCLMMEIGDVRDIN